MQAGLSQILYDMIFINPEIILTIPGPSFHIGKHNQTMKRRQRRASLILVDLVCNALCVKSFLAETHASFLLVPRLVS